MNKHPGFESPQGLFLPEMTLGGGAMTDAMLFWRDAYIAILRAGGSSITAKYNADEAMRHFIDKVNPK